MRQLFQIVGSLLTFTLV